jgi:hypothetical protein
VSSFTTAVITQRTDLLSIRGFPMLHVQQPIVYEIGFLGSNHPVVIPAGFLTDGPSVPRLLQFLMPMDHLLAPSVLHDWLLTQLAWEKSRADLEFKIAMRACGVRQPYRQIAYWAVHFNHSPRQPPQMLPVI